MKERYPNKRFQREQHPRQQLQPQQPPQLQQPQHPQSPPQEEQRKEKWIEVLSLFHQRDGGKYKKLGVYVSDESRVILSLTEGEAKGEYTRINFQLDEQEVIYLAEKLRALFFRLK
jgi:hypothetical protein